ncbi:unnamed protein product [Tuber melanosporum]|uniref:(Perigord truffle) hypothetical protein n=1 Tax=Tuber melanosporum (strain Mel28) TaxID=656061 RepID=D5GFT3_TUBMM|nr:uncharacterized protein GSTUM_00007065001 [Tuber melanosporum]CAZ83376.1 unnamed protein product [Tuber melanosporum]
MKMPSGSKDALSERIHTSLRSFNYHASDCPSCCDPYSVHLSKTLVLCDVGHALAQEAAEALYAKARTTPMGQIDVTFPEGWESVDGLIKSITHRLQGTPSNRIDLEAMKNAKMVSSNAARRIEAERRGKITYVSAEEVSRGSSFAMDLSRRGIVEVASGPAMQRSRSKHYRYPDPSRSSGLDLIATAHDSHRHHHHHHHGRRADSHSSREHGSPRSTGRAVTFNPDIEMRYF